MKDVGVIFDKSGKGGGIYNQLVTDVIQNNFNVETYEVMRSQQNKLYNFSKLYYELSKLRGQKDVWIRTSNPVITLPFDDTQGKNIALIHHIDNTFKPASTKILSSILHKVLMRNLNLVDKIVVVSQFWKEHFESLGYESVEIIYNPFDLKEFTFSDDAIETFKAKYQLSGKPIVYLGNCQKAKGVVEAYEALKGLDAQLVTSGARDVSLPAVHLNVNYREYLMLLQAASVAVTMSKFNEGWCRTAHEAMLCKTPVVGSGMGGMGELLEGGNQIICHDFSKLRDSVEYAMDDSKLGEAGYAFAIQDRFTLKSFKNEWIHLIDSL
jgi:glycosyltransferase involved in cell wall biosynthesis